MPTAFRRRKGRNTTYNIQHRNDVMIDGRRWPPSTLERGPSCSPVTAVPTAAPHGAVALDAPPYEQLDAPRRQAQAPHFTFYPQSMSY
eukprot:scaffold28278_cov26-Tisochrysis_lutea.AAC.1